MFLSGVLFVMFLAGCGIAWIIARSPRRARRRRLALAHQYAILGYEAPGIGRHPKRPTAADVAFALHPATRAWHAGGPGRSVPIGPDDDPEFLRQLDDLIRGLE